MICGLYFQGGWTPLMWCCYLGYTELVHYLLENNANCNLRGEVSVV